MGIERNIVFLAPFILLFAWGLPIAVVVWFMLKISSMERTLRDISAKLDKQNQNRDNNML